MSNLRQTPLSALHRQLGGRMVDFAGWEMPVLYSSIVQEHQTTRAHASLFDVSHMGEITVQGADAEKLLRSLVPTSMDKLVDGMGMYTCLCNSEGGVVDDIFIFRIAGDNFYLVVNAGTREKDYNWITDHAPSGVEIQDISSSVAKIDIQGPRAAKIAAKVFTDGDINGIARFHFITLPFKGTPVMVSRTGYTGEDGFEFFLPSDEAENLWNALTEAGKEDGLAPAGLGARDTLRLEASYSLYGHELSDTITPVEAGLGWLVNSQDEYIGKEILERQKENGTERRICCLELKEKGIPREGMPLFHDSEEAGSITSGAWSPTLQRGIAMAMVSRQYTTPGTALQLSSRGRLLQAEVVKRPFYSFNG